MTGYLRQWLVVLRTAAWDVLAFLQVFSFSCVASSCCHHLRLEFDDAFFCLALLPAAGFRFPSVLADRSAALLTCAVFLSFGLLHDLS